MWKTRNIRRRNKGKKTKRQDGGLALPFMGPSMNKIIEFATNNDIDVSAYFEKKTGMLSKATTIPFKVKFIKEKKVKFIGEENELKQIDANVKTETPYTYGINGSKVEVIINLKTKITIYIDKTSIAEIKDKMKMEDAAKAEKIKEISKKTEVAQVQKKKESKYESHNIYISTYFGRDITGTLPFSNHKLNYLYYCIETYLPEDSFTKDTVHTFVKEFEKYNPNDEEKKITEMNKDNAIIRLEAGIKLFIMNDSKTKLQEIVKILNVDPDQLDDYLTPKQSLNKKCSTFSSITYDREICFIIESLKPYESVELVLLDEDNPDEKLKMSIFDFVENGARSKESWKNAFEPTIKYKLHYNHLNYVSKGTDADSLVGFLCYDYNNHTFKVSNIIWADNDVGKNLNLHNKLYDSLNDNLSGEYLHSKLFIPDELNEKVNAQKYKKGETKDGFTMWDAIVPPTPSEMDRKIDAASDKKSIDLLKLLQKLQLFFGKEKVKETPIIETAELVKEVEQQTGGADNALLDEIITKYPSLKGLKSMIDDLPEDIRQKYESEINSTLEKVKESNVEEKDLMKEPDIQEIQTDLNTQFPPPPPPTKVEGETSPTTTDDAPIFPKEN